MARRRTAKEPRPTSLDESILIIPAVKISIASPSTLVREDTVLVLDINVEDRCTSACWQSAGIWKDAAEFLGRPEYVFSAYLELALRVD